MAIWVGNTHLTGTTEIDIGGTPSTVHIGDFLTYPEGTISYTFSDIKRSSNLDIPAAGTTANTRWVTADVTVKRGSTVVATYDDVTLTPHRVSGDTTYFHITANNEIWADYRGSTTGGTRSAYFTFSYNDVNVPAAAGTFTQQANTRTRKEQTNALTAYTVNNYSYEGGDYYITCRREFEYWSAYTSGYETQHTPSSDNVSAMTYDIDYHTCNWMSSAATEGSGFPRKLVMDQNYSTGETGNRSATIKVMYPVSGEWSDYNYITASTTITQFGANYSTFDYRIYSITPSQTTWAANASGTGYTANVEVVAQYARTVHSGVTGTTGWTTSVGNWTTYTGRPDLCGNVSPIATTNGYYFYYLEHGENTGAPYGELYYPTTSTTYGSIGVYPTQTNGSAEDKTQVMQIGFGGASSSFTLTQQANTSISISPASITMPAASGQTSAFTVTTLLSGWGASADTNWLTTSISGDKVNVTTVQDNISQAATQRSATVSVYYQGTVKATATVYQQADNYVFTALSVTSVTLAASATSYNSLAVQSFSGYTPVPISNSNVSITNNTMNLNISGSVTSAGTGVYAVPLSCSTNTSTTTPKHATLTITQPGSGKQIVYSFTQTVADGTPAGVTKIADLGDGWILGTVWIANAGTSPNYEPVNMIVIVRKDSTVSRTITLTGDYVTFAPPDHQRNVITINPNPRTYNYTAGATFSLTSLDPSMPGTYTFNGVNTTLTGVNANVSISSSSTPPSGMMYITIT